MINEDKPAVVPTEPTSTTPTRRSSDDSRNFKSVLKSKTFWINVIALIAIVVQQRFGFVIDENIQFQILGIVNIGLRFLTKEPVNWNPIPTKDKADGTT